jgi:hypothetical protein
VDVNNIRPEAPDGVVDPEKRVYKLMRFSGSGHPEYLNAMCQENIVESTITAADCYLMPKL